MAKCGKHGNRLVQKFKQFSTFFLLFRFLNSGPMRTVWSGNYYFELITVYTKLLCAMQHVNLDLDLLSNHQLAFIQINFIDTRQENYFPWRQCIRYQYPQGNYMVLTIKNFKGQFWKIKINCISIAFKKAAINSLFLNSFIVCFWEVSPGETSFVSIQTVAKVNIVLRNR